MAAPAASCPEAWTMLHLTKLAVGVRDIAHLGQIQQSRAATEPPLRHRTRSFPRRAAEVTDGGSIYWVVAGATVVRQRVLAIRPDSWDDGRACAALLLEATLIAVVGRVTRPFQGWRYLNPDAAPADLSALAPTVGADGLPDDMRRELAMLGLI